MNLCFMGPAFDIRVNEGCVHFWWCLHDMMWGILGELPEKRGYWGIVTTCQVQSVGVIYLPISLLLLSDVIVINRTSVR